MALKTGRYKMNSMPKLTQKRSRCLVQAAVLIFFSLFCCSMHAQDQEVVNLGATITGNQEQPKVLYIVPWKQTKDTQLLEQGLESRLSDVFDHVERNEHQRELEYFETLVGDTSNQE